MENSAGRRLGYRAALASSQFRVLCAAQLVSITGTSVAAVALTVLVYRRTASPVLASLTFSLGFLPYLFGGAVLSSLVDRIRPRPLVNVCDAGTAVLAATMALPGMPVAGLLGLLFASGTMSSLASGARATLVRATVPEDAYVPGRSLLRIAGQLAQIGGNAAGGALLLLLSPSGALLINAVGCSYSAVSVRLGVANHPHLGPPDKSRTLRSWQGVRAVLGPSELRRLLVFGWLIPMFSVAPEAVAAPYVAAHHQPSSFVGWWLMALPAGIIAGDMAGVRWLSADRQRQLVAPVALLSFLPYLLFIANPPVSLAMGLLVLSGLASVYGLGLDGRVREASPPDLFARAMTVNSAGLMALQGLGFTMAGALAQALNPGVAVAIAGVAGATSTVVILRSDFAGRRSSLERPGAAGF